MHFHWDNFDTIAARVLRSFAPPIINLILISIFFRDTISEALRWTKQEISKGTSSLPEINLSILENPDSITETLKAVNDKILANVTGNENDIKWDVIQIWIENLSSIIFSVAFTLFITFLFLAFFLDWVIRLLGRVLPFELSTNEDRLLYLPEFDRFFNLILKKSWSEANNGTVSYQEPAKPKFWNIWSPSKFDRMHIWLQIRQVLDQTKPKESDYKRSRDALLTDLTTNQKYGSYLAPYLLLLIISVGQDTPNELFSLFTFVVWAFATVWMLRRQFILSRDLVRNDLETYVATQYDTKLQLIELQTKKLRPTDWLHTLSILRFVHK